MQAERFAFACAAATRIADMLNVQRRCTTPDEGQQFGMIWNTLDRGVTAIVAGKEWRCRL
jgi:hypothetical protein